MAGGGKQKTHVCAKTEHALNVLTLYIRQASVFYSYEWNIILAN